MKASVKKGMILCAGMGTRLLPVTEKLPKPLVPVLNLPNLLHNLYLMKEAGITEVVLNLHHLGEQIEAVLGNGSRFGIRMAYSHEPVLLGTGGGVKKAEPFFEGQTFVLMNCDFVTNIPIAPVIEQHLHEKALATMVLLQDEIRERAYSPVGVNEAGHLCSLPKLKTATPKRTGIFTGIHVLHPSTLAVLKPEPSGINEILYPHYMRTDPTHVRGEFVSDVYWHDTGNVPFLWATSMALLDEISQHRHGLLARCLIDFANYTEARPGIWTKKGQKLPANVAFEGPVIIGEDCQFGEGATIGPRAVIGDNSHIGAKAKVSRSVLLGDAQVSDSESLQRVVRYGKAVLPLAE